MKSLIDGIGTIFMLHRVFPVEPKLQPNEDLKVNPEFLESFILDAQRRGFTFISLDQLVQNLKTDKTHSQNLVMTMDDGYLDNYTHAYPIFKKHNVPFTIYITTSFPDRSAILWWLSLEDLILSQPQIKLANGMTFATVSPSEKVSAFLKIRSEILKLTQDNLLSGLISMFSAYNINWKDKVEEVALSWEDIQVLSRDPLVTIGSHTVNHPNLSKLSEEKLLSEVELSRHAIESRIGKEVKHFCYPFGSRHEAGSREFDLLKKMSFTSATTTRSGNVFPAHKDFTESLPRIFLKNDFSWSKQYWQSFKRFLKGRMVVK